jgi:hypothetical protein
MHLVAARSVTDLSIFAKEGNFIPAFTIAISKENGERVEPRDVGMDPEWPAETIVTVSFEDNQGRTKFTLRQTVDESIAKRTGAYPSWLEMLDRLAERLTSE